MSIITNFANYFLDRKREWSINNDRFLGAIETYKAPTFNNPMDIAKFISDKLVYKKDMFDSYTNPQRLLSLLVNKGTNADSNLECDCDDYANLMAFMLKHCLNSSLVAKVYNVKLVNVLDQYIQMSHVICSFTFDNRQADGKIWYGYFDTNGSWWVPDTKPTNQQVLDHWKSIYTNAKYIELVECDPVFNFEWSTLK